MPNKKLTGVVAWNNEIPTPEDGDLATEASLDQALQQLANNARWLLEQITVQGVSAIRGVSSFDDLRRLKNPNHGQVAYVWLKGIYVYIEGSGMPDAPPWILSPAVTDGPSTGRWFHELANMQNIPSGVETTNAQHKIQPEIVPNGLVGMFEKIGGSWTTPSTTRIEVPDFSITIAARVGDMFQADWSGSMMTLRNTPGASQPTDYSSFVPVVRDSATDYPLNGHEARITHNPNFQNTRFFVGMNWKAQTTEVVFKAQIAVGSGDQARFDGGQIRVTQFRP